MANVSGAGSPKPSPFEKKVEGIIRGKVRAFSGLQAIGVMTVHWIRPSSKKYQEKAEHQTDRAIYNLVRNELSKIEKEGRAAGLSDKQVKRLKDTNIKRLRGSVYEVGKRVSNAVAKRGLLGSVYEAVKKRVSKATGKAGEKPITGLRAFYLTNEEMASETPDVGEIKKDGEKIGYFHAGKGDHGGRNEDAYKIIGEAVCVADGTSEGGESSAQVSRLFASAAANALEKLRKSGKLGKMKETEVAEFVENEIVKSSKQYSRQWTAMAKVEGSVRAEDGEPDFEEYGAIHGKYPGASTTGVAAVKLESKGKTTIYGVGIGDTSFTVVNFKTGSVKCPYQVERSNQTSTGGFFSPLSIPEGESFYKDIPDYRRNGGAEHGLVPFKVEVDKEDFVFMASDALYDNLLGETIEEKNTTLMAILQDPKFDEIQDQLDTPKLPNVTRSENSTPPKDAAQAVQRLRNYLDWAMPTRKMEKKIPEDANLDEWGKSDDATIIGFTI